VYVHPVAQTQWQRRVLISLSSQLGTARRCRSMKAQARVWLGFPEKFPGHGRPGPLCACIHLFSIHEADSSRESEP